MSGLGMFMVGVAVGLILGGLSTYGAIFAWAVRYGKDSGEDDEE
jgi:hypothetical protein